MSDDQNVQSEGDLESENPITAEREAREREESKILEKLLKDVIRATARLTKKGGDPMETATRLALQIKKEFCPSKLVPLLIAEGISRGEDPLGIL